MSEVLHVGFTATRYGLSVRQRRGVLAAFSGLLCPRPTGGIVAHHGCCVGGDVDCHEIVSRFGGIPIHGHPGPDHYYASWISCDFRHPRLGHMARNRAIVDACSVIIAAPFENEPQPRGGTWATIRMALKAKHRPTLYVVGREGQLLNVEKMR